MLDEVDTTTSFVEIGDEDSVQDAFIEGFHLWSLLVVGYTIVFFVGVIGNTVFLAALCGSGSRARALPVRNYVMINLAVADLLVTGMCVPILACAAASHVCWPNIMVTWMCQLGPLLQRAPVAASTLSLALLSLDRWVAVRHPRFAQRFRDRSFVAMLVVLIWTVASVVAAPIVWARQWQLDHVVVAIPTDPVITIQQKQESNTSAEIYSDAATGVCLEQWANIALRLAYVAIYLGTSFVLPALIVAACHASVSYKLTRQLQVLTESVARTEAVTMATRPPKILIVAMDPSNNVISNSLYTKEEKGKCRISIKANKNLRGREQNKKEARILEEKEKRVLKHARPSCKLLAQDPNDDDDDDPFVRMQIEADLESFRQVSQLHCRKNSSINGNDGRQELRAARKEKAIIRANRNLRNKMVSSAPHSINPAILPTNCSQSFHSRRKAANLLAALAGVFVFCWAPYVCCALCEIFLANTETVRLVIPFALMLGHAHSAINPIVSWRLNRSAFVHFQQHKFLSSVYNFLRYCRSCTANCCHCCAYVIRSCCVARSADSSNSIELEHIQHQKATATNNRFLTVPNQASGQNRRHLARHLESNYYYSNSSETSCNCFQKNMSHRESRAHQNDDQEGIPCCCCFCPANGPFGRRGSSPDTWNWRESSTSEAHLGAFHPKYLSRLPVVHSDQISKCHTSHFLQ